jgi:hypothetical protein
MKPMLAVRALLPLLVAADLAAEPPYRAKIEKGRAFRGPGAPDCNTINNAALNCGFETGAFPPWIPQDITTPFFPLQVGTGGVNPGFGLFTSAPTEGTFAVLHGFDGDGPGSIFVSQDVVLVATADNLTFDYRAGWDYGVVGCIATQDRIFRVHIEPAGGGPPLQTTVVFTAPASTCTNLDTGNLVGTVDISPFVNQAVRIVFEWFIPETFTGPGFFQLDNVLAHSPVPVELMNFEVE